MTRTEFGQELTDDAPVGAAIGGIGRRRTPARVPASRYTDPAWAALEEEHVWPRSWLLACTTDHLGAAGDFFEFEIGRLSVLIVHTDDGLRAFQNVCLHRGNILCTGSGSGLTEIRCPYHRWSWDLQGRLREIPSRKGFGGIRSDELPLIDVQVATWGPLVFINLDPDAEPLISHLDTLPEMVSWADLDQYACRYDLTVALPCNWKTLIEGFSETYHVQGIHREMLPSVDDVNSVNRLHGRHGSLYQPYGIASPRLRHGATHQEMWDSIISTQGSRFMQDPANPGPAPELATGETLRDRLETLARQRATNEGWSFDQLDQAQVLDLYQLNLFPNATVIVMSDNISCIRARPGATPDEAFMDVVSLQRVAPGADRSAKPTKATLPADSASLGLVFDQDLANLRRAQRGLHQPGFTHLTLSREEMRIMNLHRNLEECIGMASEFAPETLVEIAHLRAGGS